MGDNETIQPDLFGANEKRERRKQDMIERNKADREAGIHPVPKPLFTPSEPEHPSDN